MSDKINFTVGKKVVVISEILTGVRTYEVGEVGIVLKVMLDEQNGGFVKVIWKDQSVTDVFAASIIPFDCWE